MDTIVNDRYVEYAEEEDSSEYVREWVDVSAEEVSDEDATDASLQGHGATVVSDPEEASSAPSAAERWLHAVQLAAETASAAHGSLREVVVDE